MKKFLVVLVFIIFIFSCQKAYANGGPGDGASLLIGGNINFVDTPDIFIERENLNINTSPYSTVVTVEYTLKNTGAARELDYIFPVTNYLFDMYDDASIEWIVFYDNGIKLDYSLVENEKDAENTTYGNANLEDDPAFGSVLNGQEVQYYKIRNTYYDTKLHFAKGETKTLIVTYKADTSYTSWGTSKSPRNDFSDMVFLYDLRPAAAWGNGKAAEFNLRVDYTELRLARDININSGEFKRDISGIFTYSKKDFSFADMGILSIVVDYPFEYLENSSYQWDWVKKVYASSTLPSYDNRYSVENLFDGNINMVWATNGNGVGAVLEIEFDYGGFLGILNGFVRSKELYYDNARIKKIKVEEGYYWSDDFIVREPWEYEFEDIPYEQIDRNLPRMNVPYFHGAQFVRLTILEVYPGKKYQDVCISQIYMLDYPGRLLPWYYVSDIPFFGQDTPEQDIPEISDMPNSSVRTTVPTPAIRSTEPSMTEERVPAKDETGGENDGITAIIICAVVLCGAGAVGGVLYVRRKSDKKNTDSGDN